MTINFILNKFFPLILATKLPPLLWADMGTQRVPSSILGSPRISVEESLSLKH